MDETPRVTIGFTIKGADPNNKLPEDAVCAVCDQKISEHTKEMLRACAAKTRLNKVGPTE